MPKKSMLPLNKPMSRRSFFRGIGGFIANHWLLSSIPAAGAGVLGKAEYDTRNLKLQKWDLFYPNLPSALTNKKICQLSDLHLESLRISPEHIRQSVQSEKPDLLVLTGDIISVRTDLNKLNLYLEGLSAPQGNYVVMGNNDYSHLSHTLFKRLARQFKNLGWTLLINQAEFLPQLNLWLIGIDDPATAHDDVDLAYAKVLSAQELPENPSFRLVLTHSTDCLDDVAKYGADLLLAGHTHGGQVRLPGLKPFITNTYLGDLGFYEGYHVINGVPLYINAGIGESMIPLRFNVPPEIAFFTLHQGNAQANRQTE